MKTLMRSAMMAGVLGAGALLMATPATAGQWDGHPDLESSILNDRDRPAYVGTGMSETRARVFVPGVYDAAGAFPNHEIDQNGFVTGMSGPEKGDSDNYGSILFDVGAWK